MITLLVARTPEFFLTSNKRRSYGQELREYQALSPLVRFLQRLLYRFL